MIKYGAENLTTTNFIYTPGPRVQSRLLLEYLHSKIPSLELTPIKVPEKIKGARKVSLDHWFTK